MAARQTESNANAQTEGRHALKRRGILTAAAAVVAGIAAKQMAQPVAAGVDGDVILGVGNSAASRTGVLNNGPATTPGPGLEGNRAPGAFSVSSSINAGVIGTSRISDTDGVFGQVNNGTQAKGVHGRHTVNGYGVYGETGTGTGVYGQSGGDTNSKAMYGKSINDGYGVYGEAGAGGYGVTGVVAGSNIFSRGVYGISGTNGYGVYGTVGGGVGVSGNAVSGNAIVGQSGSGVGVFGISGGGVGQPYGVVGSVNAAPAFALFGVANVSGTVGFAAGAGVTGVIAGQFAGPVNIYNNGAIAPGDLYIQGNYTAGGTKSAAVPHPDGTHRLLYCVESPEAWFEDFGEGTLTAGKAEMKLDADFAAVVDTSKLHVFLTPHDEHHLHVAQRTATGFAVTAAPSTTAAAAGKKASELSGTFSYRVVAKRKDVAAPRLAKYVVPQEIKAATPLVIPTLPTLSKGETKPVPALEPPKKP